MKDEAESLLKQGALNSLFSDFEGAEMPKYVWMVDGDGEVYEAKRDSYGYHRYRLEEEDDFRNIVLREYSRRCSQH